MTTLTKTNRLGYIPDICPSCKQSCTYVLGLDRGTVDILKGIALFHRPKGHQHGPPAQGDGRRMAHLESSREPVARARFHGLIAHARENRGNYLLTRKGAAFLRGEVVPRYAIISKALKCQVGYFAPEEMTCRISDFNGDGEYWEGINYDIEEGTVIHRHQPKLL